MPATIVARERRPLEKALWLVFSALGLLAGLWIDATWPAPDAPAALPAPVVVAAPETGDLRTAVTMLLWTPTPSPTATPRPTPAPTATPPPSDVDRYGFCAPGTTVPLSLCVQKPPVAYPTPYPSCNVLTPVVKETLCRYPGDREGTTGEVVVR